MEPVQYARARTASTGQTVATDAGTETVVAAATDGSLTVVGRNEDRRLDLDAAPTDVALGADIYLATSDAVRALTMEGDVQWETPVENPSQLAALPAPGRVVVRTDTAFIGLESDSGEEVFRIEHPHPDVATTHEIVAGDEYAVITAWWFLTVIDADGRTVTDVQVDGAIDSVGTLAGTAAVLLQDGRLIGLGLDTGEERWADETGIDWIAPWGTETLLASDGRDLRRFSPTGESRTLGTFDTGTWMAAASGDPVCLLNEEGLSVFRPAPRISFLDVTILERDLEPGEPLELRVTNRSQEHLRARLRVTSAQLSPESETLSAEVHPADSTVVSVPVEWTAESTATVEVECVGLDRVDPTSAGNADGTPLVQETRSLLTDSVSLVDRPPAVEAEVEVEVDAIHMGELEVTVTVSNPGDTRLENLTISGADTDLPPIEADESVVRQVSLPLDSREIRVQGEDVDVTRQLPSIQAPPLDVEVGTAAEGFVDVRVRNLTEIPVHEEFTISGEILPATIRRTVDIPPAGRLILALPVVQRTDAGTVDVSANTVTTAAELDVGTSLAELESASGFAPKTPLTPSATAEESRSEDHTREPDPNSERTPPDARHSPQDRPPVDADDGTDRDGDRTRASTAGHEETEPGTQAGPEEPEAASPAAGSGSTGGEGAESEGGQPGVNDVQQDSLTVSRRLASSEIQQGIALGETVTVSNETSHPVEVTVDSTARETTAHIPGDGTVALERHHVGYGPPGDPIDIPAVTVRSEVGTGQLPAESVSLVESALTPRVSLWPGTEGTVARVRLANGLQTPCRCSRLTIDGTDADVSFDQLVVPAGETTMSEASLPAPLPDSPAVAHLEVETDGETTSLDTVASVSIDPTLGFGFSVVDLERIEPGEFNLRLEVRNDLGIPVDIEIEARGEAPDEYLYSERAVEGVAPGDAVDHRIECTVEDPSVTIPIDLRVTPAVTGVDGEPAEPDVKTGTVIVSGHLDREVDEWQIDTAAAKGSADDERESFSTPLTEVDR